MNPQRIANLVLIFSDVVLALVVGGGDRGPGCLGYQQDGRGSPHQHDRRRPPVAVWVVLRAILGLYPGYGLNAVDELRRQSYATLGALIIASTFFGLHQGQDVSRSVLIGGFLVLLIAAPLVRQLVKWSLKKARLWGSWMTTNSR
jgi:hypothetical protein